MKWLTILLLATLYFFSPVIDVYLCKQLDCRSIIIQDPTYIFYPILHASRKCELFQRIHYALIPNTSLKFRYEDIVICYDLHTNEPQ
jgi:hypothetical protein